MPDIRCRSRPTTYDTRGFGTLDAAVVDDDDVVVVLALLLLLLLLLLAVVAAVVVPLVAVEEMIDGGDTSSASRSADAVSVVDERPPVPVESLPLDVGRTFGRRVRPHSVPRMTDGSGVPAYPPLVKPDPRSRTTGWLRRCTDDIQKQAIDLVMIPRNLSLNTTSCLGRQRLFFLGCLFVWMFYFNRSFLFSLLLLQKDRLNQGMLARKIFKFHDFNNGEQT